MDSIPLSVGKPIGEHMVMQSRKFIGPGLVLATAVALTAALPQALGQSNYPNRVIRLVAPTSPGGPNDVIARLIAQALSERLRRQGVVEKRTGGGTTIGSTIVCITPPAR